jgi:hypothetical protein
MICRVTDGNRPLRDIIPEQTAPNDQLEKLVPRAALDYTAYRFGAFSQWPAIC